MSTRSRGHRGPLSPAILLAGALLIAFALQAVSSLRQKSITVDEGIYISAGYYHWKTGDFRFNQTNPPLLKLVAALPLLALDLELGDLNGDVEAWSEVRQSNWARGFVYMNRTDAETILLAARLPTVLIGAALGAYVFAWSRRLYGERAALLALLLYAFSPNLLAHARLATQDVGLTAFSFIAAYHFWCHVHRPRWRSLVATGFFFTAALLSKPTAALMIPAAVAYLAIAVIGRPERGIWTRLPWVARVDPQRVVARQLVSLSISAAGIGAVSLLALNAFYGFERIAWPLPVPDSFLELIRYQSGKVSHGAKGYLLGEISREGWWYWMLFAFLIKTPVPLLCLLLASGASLIRERRVSDAEWLYILVCCSFLGFFTLFNQGAVALRYALPIFPFVHVLASRVLRNGLPRPAWGRVALASLAVWYVGGALHTHPHYLPYFNELIGGPSNGYRYLSDSNLDWGQDLPALKRYMEENDIPRIRLAYFGGGHAPHYGIDYEYMPSVGLEPLRPEERRFWVGVRLPPPDPFSGPIAVSASLVGGIFMPGYYTQLTQLEPKAQIGHSILVYDESEP